VIIFAISLSIFAALRPYLLKQTVDGYIATEDKQGLLHVVLMGIVLLFEVFLNFTSCFGQTGWSGYCKRHTNETVSTHFEFPMKYLITFLGSTVTRSVSDTNLLLEFLVKVYSWLLVIWWKWLWYWHSCFIWTGP
jgi:ABC-type multidrug transport system fused ATPase/permease subunit